MTFLAPRPAWTLLCLPVLLTSCGGDSRPADVVGPVVYASPEGVDETDPVFEREVTLYVDPAAGTIRADASREVLALLESDLALDFDVANLTQASGQTSFLLVIRNRGDYLVGLSMGLEGERALISPANPIQFGGLGEGAEVNQLLAFDNPQASAFLVKLHLWASFQTDGNLPLPGAPGPTPVSDTPTPSAVTPMPGTTPRATSPSPSPPSPTPSATPLVSPSASPTALPSASPTARPSASPSVGPSASPSASAAPVGSPGPGAARGRILLNGRAPFKAVSLSLIRTPGWNSRTVTTDAQGYFGASGLEPGDYMAYFYNETNREMLGYWRSRNLKVDATTGADFPSVDLFQKGLQNEPAMDAHTTLPVTFQWLPQTQAVVTYRFRLHSNGGRTFTLLHQSDRIPGDAKRFTWDGAGLTLSPTNRYFWGLSWDAGPVGEGGNLYQPIYFNP